MCNDMWGCIKTPYLFKLPKITLSFFFPPIVFSGGELPVDKKCEFTSSMGVKELFVEDQNILSCVQSSTWIIIVKHLST